MIYLRQATTTDHSSDILQAMDIMPRPKRKKRQRTDSEEVDSDLEQDKEDQGGSDVEQDEAEIVALQVWTSVLLPFLKF